MDVPKIFVPEEVCVKYIQAPPRTEGVVRWNVMGLFLACFLIPLF